MSLQTEPLFVGPTRPTMLLGVTLNFLLANVMLVGMVQILVGNPLMLLGVVPGHAVAWLLCRDDPRTLEILGLWARTKGACLNRFSWGCSSSGPLPGRTKPQRQTA